MITIDKKIGIWGFGITGKAVVNYLHAQGFELVVMDKKTLSEADIAYLQNKNIPFYSEGELATFLAHCDLILPSPGIDLRSYAQFKHKWLSELDLFYAAWKKPIIAITGSIGKTTITHILSKVLEHTGLKVATGGNIGIPMFDLLTDQDSYDIALLEISSFQLELCKQFAPHLAIWTNFYPNHLDRHSSEAEYFNAKATLFAYQTKEDHALVPVALAPQLNIPSTTHYFSLQKPDSFLQSRDHNSAVFFKDQNQFIAHNTNHPLITCDQLPALSFEENWLIICAALTILKIKLPNFLTITELSLPEHRLEKIATLNGVDFYNDSKSTTIQSTAAAINRLCSNPILLLLGGLSKGVDRSPLIQEVAGKVKKIYCFGKEAEQLKAMCDMHKVPNSSHVTLDEAVAACKIEMLSGDQVLLSPAGSSYDLFTNYIERGNHFKKLVKETTSLT